MVRFANIGQPEFMIFMKTSTIHANSIEMASADHVEVFRDIIHPNDIEALRPSQEAIYRHRLLQGQKNTRHPFNLLHDPW